MNIKFKEFFYISNILSLLRVFIGIPIFYYLGKTDQFSFWMVPVLGFLAIITDYLDGYFSRKFNQITELGKIIDPIADKICSFFVLFGIIVYRGYPAGVLFLLMYRDILITIFGSIISKKEGKVVSSIFLGKLNTTLIGLSAILFVLKISSFIDITLILACYISIFVSGLAYLRIGENMLNLSVKGKILFRSGISVLTLLVLIVFVYLELLSKNFMF